MTNLPYQTVANSSAGRDINQSIVIAGGSTLGSGVWKWTTWQDRVQKGAPGSLAASTRLVAGGRFIKREVYHEALDAARAYLTGKSSRRSIVVYGKHGTGRSMVAMAAIQALSQDGFEHLYVVDDYLRFSQTDLSTVIPKNVRSLVVIDDADLQSALRPLYNAVGSVDICALVTVAHPRSAGSFAALDSHPNSTLNLPGRPTADEIELLRAAVAGPPVSKRHERNLGQYNIRSVSRVLAGDGPPMELAQRLIDLRYEDRVSAAAISVLSKCGERSITVPSELLFRVIGEYIPEALSPWLQTRPLYGEDAVSQAVWIEDFEVLTLSERLWRTEYVLDWSVYEQELRDTLGRVYEAVSPANPGDRLVARQLLKRSRPSTVVPVANAHVEKIVACILEEKNRASLLAWRSALPATGVNEKDRVHNAFLQQLALQEPDFGALVAILMDLASDATIDDDDLSAVADSAGINLWASVLELFEGRRGEALGIAAFRLLLDCVSRHDDAREILHLYNSAQILGNTVPKQGLHYHRKWLRDSYLQTDPFRLSFVTYLLEVSQRCVMQDRHRIALDPRWYPPTASQDDVAALQAAYDRQVLAKGENRVEEVIERTISVLTDATQNRGARDHAWSQVIGFAEYHERSKLNLLCLQALEFGVDAWASNDLQHGHIALSKALRLNRRTQLVTMDQLRVLVLLAAQQGFGTVLPSTVIFPLLHAAAESDVDDVRAVARRTIRSLRHAIIEKDKANFEHAWMEFASRLDPAVATGDSGSVSAGFDSAHAVHQSDSAAIGSFAAWPAEERSGYLEFLTEQYTNPTVMNSTLFSSCITFERLDLAERLIPAGWEAIPEWVLDVARFKAVKGDLTAARQLYSDLRHREILRADGRAKPVRVSIFQRELAQRTIGFESSMWSMLAGLTKPGELQPRVTGQGISR